MVSFYLFWCLSYFVLLSWLARNWPKAQINLSFRPLEEKVTLVIPFRNEQSNSDSLFRALINLSNPGLEILLVDDQSEDNSYEIFNQWEEEIFGLKVLKSPGIGKKAALELGIGVAEGSIILTSDADCQFPLDWVRHLSDPFANKEVQLVAGPVISRERRSGFFQRFQQIEWSSILLMTNYFFQQKKPLMCSGANLAFRKSAFEQVKGYQGNEQFLSGDDEFLLKKISLEFGEEACIYLPFEEALVVTTPQNDWTSLLNQRIRWAGKWKLHRSLSHALISILAFLAQLVWISSVFFFYTEKKYLIFLVLIWASKIQSERKVLGSILESLGVRVAPWDYLSTGLIHPFYVIWVGLGVIRGKFTWKGRSN